jgi:hypothetical protein
MADDDRPKCPHAGEVYPIGDGFAAIHGEAHDMQFATMRNVKHGTPMLPGERLAKRGSDGVLRVVEGFTASGPAQVATPAYRGGWERIFGGKHVVGEA